LRSIIGKIARCLLWLLLGWFTLTVGAVLLLRFVDPPTSAFMVRDRFDAWWNDEPRYQFRHSWVDGDRISAQLKLAVIASEDQKFPDHYGFDLASINDALEARENGRRVRGASTITQQVAKNLFLWPGQNWLRKGIEAYFAVLIEAFWSKRRIMEVYLNVAEFGRGTYGAEAAARRFFKKTAAQLNADDAALMAAVLPNPVRLRIVSPSMYVKSRQTFILRQMRGLGIQTVKEL